MSEQLPKDRRFMLAQIVSQAVASAHAGLMSTGRVKGETTARKRPKVGRNEPCPCGCGLKFKRHLGMRL